MLKKVVISIQTFFALRCTLSLFSLDYLYRKFHSNRFISYRYDCVTHRHTEKAILTFIILVRINNFQYLSIAVLSIIITLWKIHRKHNYRQFVDVEINSEERVAEIVF